MSRITLTFNLAPGHQALDALERSLNDMTPVHKEMGEHLVSTTQSRFDTGTAPDGSKWAPNTPLTLSRKKGNKPGIGETRALSTLIHYEPTADGVTVGSPMEYAATFHFGALMGAFGRYSQLKRRTQFSEGDFRREAGTKKGFPIPWANIPSRQFLGVSDADRTELLAILADWFGESLPAG